MNKQLKKGSGSITGGTIKKFVILILAICLATPLTYANAFSTNATQIEESFFKSGSSDYNYVELWKVKDNIWVHTTYSRYNGMRTPSNGVIAITSQGLILIDTPWNNSQTRELIALTKRVFHKDIMLAIITHAHEDRIGGIEALLEDKINIRSTNLTAEEAEKYGYKKPPTELNSETQISLDDTTCEIFYPGEGHTIDNITVWFPQSRVLFGGCLVKSLESKNIGNTTDANINQWPTSVSKVLKKYSDAEIVIPGHGKWGSLDLLNHTLDLLEN